jgi:hypothetical protein
MFVYIALLVGLGIALRSRVTKAGYLPGFHTLLERATMADRLIWPCHGIICVIVAIALARSIHG